MGQHFERNLQDGILILTFDSKGESTNVLGHSVMAEFEAELPRLEQDAGIKGLVIISGKKDFIVGADIKMIEGYSSAEVAEADIKRAHEIFNRFGKLPFTTVAAIHGQALGGGLELALACDYRVATDDSKTKLGFPEIQLGLIPGAGGTQRTPRLIGLQASLDLILTGKRIDGKRALKMGLVDANVHPHLLLNEAIKLAQKPKRRREAKKKSLTQRLPDWALEGNPVGRKVIEKKTREMVDKSSKGFYPAPLKAIDVIFQGHDLSLEKGLDIEARVFAQLTQTRESKSLIHLFHATTQLKKHPYVQAGKERFGEHKANLVGVVGAGFMGTGIATVLADKEIKVRLSDPSKESIGKSLKHINDFFMKKAEKRRLKPFEAVSRFSHVSPGLNTSGFGACDVVIEAVFEDLNLKQKILQNIEAQAKPEQIFASNTSALPIQDIAAKAQHPDRILGMHFFSPVEKMPLLEIVRMEQTAEWALARAAELGQDMGKQVIIVKDSPGFYTTRVLAFFITEAMLMLSSGEGTIEQIDKALTEFGFPVGPIALLDEVGIDVGLHVMETIQKAFPQRFVEITGVKEVQSSGRLGRKNNQGFYVYKDGKKAGVDPSVYGLLKIGKAERLSNEDIVDRCLLVFVNESIRCLEEKILANPYDGDVGAVFGLGFPPFWGGPFRYVDHQGAEKVCGRLRELAAHYGERFVPAPTLERLARDKGRFFTKEG